MSILNLKFGYLHMYFVNTEISNLFISVYIYTYINVNFIESC